MATNDTRSKMELTEEQISYIQKPSISSYMVVLYLVFRKMYVLWILLLIAIGFQYYFIENFQLQYANWISFGFTWPLIIILFFFGRRISWKLNQWQSFEAFKESEKRWFWLGLLSITVGIITALVKIFAERPSLPSL